MVPQPWTTGGKAGVRLPSNLNAQIMCARMGCNKKSMVLMIESVDPKLTSPLLVKIELSKWEAWVLRSCRAMLYLDRQERGEWGSHAQSQCNFTQSCSPDPVPTDPRTRTTSWKLTIIFTRLAPALGGERGGERARNFIEKAVAALPRMRPCTTPVGIHFRPKTCARRL